MPDTNDEFCALVVILAASILATLGSAANTVVVTQINGIDASLCYSASSRRRLARILEEGSTAGGGTSVGFDAGISVTEECTGSTCNEANVGTPNDEVASTALQNIESTLEQSVSTTGDIPSTLVQTIQTVAADSEDEVVINSVASVAVSADAVTVDESSVVVEARILTSSPTTSPSSSPSTKPSVSPTPVPKADAVLKGSISVENVSSRRRLVSNLPEGFIDAVQDSICALVSYEDCTTTVTKINGQSVGRVRGRQLQSSIILIEFETIIQFICDAGCSTSPQAIQTLADSVYQQASSDLRSAITSAALINSIGAASSDIANLLANANISGDYSQVVVPLLALLNWYPNWSGGSNTCKNGINNAPLYMRLNTLFFENSLEACCKRYYSWAYIECAGENAVTPSGYFPNWGGTSGTAEKCLNDGELLPEYMQNDPDTWLMDSVEKCCERYFSWTYNDCIVATSGGSVTSTGSLKWYFDGDICTQDCREDGALCGGFANSWNELFDTASACCAGKLSWIPRSTCVAQSTKTAVASSGQWFVDWSLEKCVKDCDNSADVDCGGIANTWDQLHASSGACCERIWYVDDCTKGSSRK